MATLAVVILTKNEEKNIKDSIASASFADDILVVDSGSQDNTEKLVKEAGARSIYLGNIYIPLEDPIQGFLMTNEQIRPKDEFRNPSKLNEVSEMIQAGRQNSG